MIQRSPPGMAIATCLLVLLSAVDAGMTMTLLPLGAVEWNPLMAVLIDGQPTLFVHTKLAMTGAGALTLVVLSMLAPAKRHAIACVLHGLTGLYVALVVYEGFLFYQLS